jgi:hypothetical protein
MARSSTHKGMVTTTASEPHVLFRSDKIISKGKSPEEILKAAELAERKIFWNGIHNYADSYLMPLANELKHSQGRLRTIVFSYSATDIRPGFYLEEVDSSGTAQHL